MSFVTDTDGEDREERRTSAHGADEGKLTRGEWAILILAMVAVPVILAPYLVAPLGRDQANWYLMGMNLMEGRVLYRDIAIVNTPALAIYYAGLRLVFGHQPELSVYLLQVFSTWGSAVFLFFFVRSLASTGEAVAALVGFALFWPLLFTNWELAQKDVVALPWVICACWLAVRQVGDGERHWLNWTAAGVAVGLAALTKTLYGGLGIVIWLVMVLRFAAKCSREEVEVTETALRIWKSSLSLLAGFGIVWLPFMFYLWVTGALGNALGDLFVRAGAYGAAYRRGWLDLLGEMTILTVPAVMGMGILVWMLPKFDRGGRRQWYGLILAVLLGVVFIQGRGWMHHMLPFLGVVLALSVAHGWRVARDGGWMGNIGKGLAVAFLAAMVLHTAQNGVPRQYELWAGGIGGGSQERFLSQLDYTAMIEPRESRELARFLQAQTEASETLSVWGMESQIYVYANRQNAGRACCDAQIYHPGLVGERPNYFAERLREYKATLRDETPAFLLVVSRDAYRVEPIPSNVTFQQAPGLQKVVDKHFEVLCESQKWKLYESSERRARRPAEVVGEAELPGGSDPLCEVQGLREER